MPILSGSAIAAKAITSTAPHTTGTLPRGGGWRSVGADQATVSLLLTQRMRRQVN